MLKAGRFDDAVAFFRRAVEDGGERDAAARALYRDAVTRGIRVNDWPYALRGLVAAKAFAGTAGTRTELDFWHGWARKLAPDVFRRAAGKGCIPEGRVSTLDVASEERDDRLVSARQASVSRQVLQFRPCHENFSLASIPALKRAGFTPDLVSTCNRPRLAPRSKRPLSEKI